MFYPTLFAPPQTQVIVISDARYAEIQAEELKRRLVVIESELNRISGRRLELEDQKEKLQAQINKLLVSTEDKKS